MLVTVLTAKYDWIFGNFSQQKIR